MNTFREAMFPRIIPEEMFGQFVGLNIVLLPEGMDGG
jgi:hypothetical protein